MEDIEKRVGGVGGKFDPRSNLYWSAKQNTDGITVREAEVERKEGEDNTYEEVEY